MSQKLSFGRDINNYNAYAPMPSADIYTATLVANTATSITVPVNFPTWIVSYRYSPGSSVFVCTTGDDATLPVGATLASSTSELNPAAHTLSKGTTISLITADTSDDVAIVMWPTGTSQ